MAPSKSNQSAAQKREAFFGSINKEKLDTLRWSVRHGGLTPATRDAHSRTALMLAAAGKPRALRELLEAVRYSSAIDRREMLDARDDDGRTALMVAANVGAFECVELLREAGANVGAKDERGRDARYYAAAKVAAPGARSQAARAEEKKVVDLLDGKLDEESEEEEQEEDVPDDGLTSTQRNKLKKKLLREQENKGAAAAEAQKKAASGGDDGGDEGAEGDAAEEDAPKEPPAEPKWEEIAQALASGKKEIKCLRAGDVEDDEGVPAGQCDAALWRCTSANRVELKCGLAGDGSALAGIAALTGLTTLVLSGNALTGIPAAIGKLKALKTFECEANGLTTLPDEMKKLKALEVLRLQRNKLASLASLSKLTNLVVLDASFNALATLDFDLSNKTRLGTLLLKGNELTELPEDAGDLEALQSLNVSDNKLTELPASMGGLEKKLKEIVCDGNEFADPKLRKLVGGKVKDILKYLQKAGSGKGKGKKKK